MNLAVLSLIVAVAFSPTLLVAGAIHDAVESRDSAGLARMLAADPGLAIAVDGAGFTPLHLAVHKGAVDIATFLVKNTQSAYFAAFLDTRTTQGRQALAAGDTEQAYEMLTDMLRKYPANANINFAQGLASYSTGRYSLAKLAFERVLEIEPENGRAGAELGRTHLAMGNPDMAARYLQEALAKSTSEEVRRKIEADLRHATQGASRWKGQLRAYAGYLDDSNVNVGPDSDIISIWPIVWGSTLLTSLSLQDSSKPLDAQGEFVSLMWSEAYDAGRPGGWSATGDLAYYQNWLDSRPDYESVFGQFRLGMKRMRERDLWHVPVKFAHIATGGDPLVNIYGLAPRYVCVAGRTGDKQWQTDVSGEYRDYNELDDRDGFYVSVSESVRQSFGGGRHGLAMGVEVFHDYADARPYEHTGTAWKLGADISLPWGFGIYSQGRYVRTDYAERETLAPDTRSDTQNQVAVGIKRTFAGRFGVDVNYQYTENSSTFTLYQYDRSVTTITTSFLF